MSGALVVWCEGLHWEPIAARVAGAGLEPTTYFAVRNTCGPDGSDWPAGSNRRISSRTRSRALMGMRGAFRAFVSVAHSSYDARGDHVTVVQSTVNPST